MLIGFIVGISICCQTFYAFVVENTRHLGALKAMGVKGFRIDAAKHMPNSHLNAVLTSQIKSGMYVFGEIITSGGAGVRLTSPEPAPAPAPEPEPAFEPEPDFSVAADDLLQRLNSLCPVCDTPGFWPDKAVPGLPCAACGSATGLTLQKQACCQRCQHTKLHHAVQRYADPQYCQECNP